MPSTPAALSSRTWRRASSGVLGVRTSWALAVSRRDSGMLRRYSVPWPPSAVNMGPQMKSWAPSLLPWAIWRFEGAGEIEAVADAACGGDAAVEQGSGGVGHGRVGVVIGLGGADAGGSAEVHVDIDQAGEQGFAGAFDGFGVDAVGIGAGALVDLGDLAVAHEDASRFR